MEDDSLPFCDPRAASLRAPTTSAGVSQQDTNAIYSMLSTISNQLVEVSGKLDRLEARYVTLQSEVSEVRNTLRTLSIVQGSSSFVAGRRSIRPARPDTK